MSARPKILTSLVPHMEESGFICMWQRSRLVTKYENQFSLLMGLDAWQEYLIVQIFDFRQSSVSMEFKININQALCAKEKIIRKLKVTPYGEMIK